MKIKHLKDDDGNLTRMLEVTNITPEEMDELVVDLSKDNQVVGINSNATKIDEKEDDVLVLKMDATIELGLDPKKEIS